MHVGCGPKALKPNWWNIDLRSFKGIDEARDVVEPWTGYSDVQYVYGEHFLEHLRLDHAAIFLSNAHSVMNLGGRIRLSTPSLEWVLATHFDATADNRERTISDTFKINRAFHGWGHQFLWSKPMLEDALKAAGFSEVSFHSYGESSDSFLAGIEEHGGYTVTNGFPSVWIVEGVKTTATSQIKEFLGKAVAEFQRFVDGGH
ncbi:hypothetical protein IP69_06305 [Bosea sp. AAP35]|nr:hypothetical protein IP69_06305 [Bosea sp. AAP35]